MFVLHDRYRVVREISLTIYGWIYVCEDMRGESGCAPESTTISSVIIKQVSLGRMASFMQDCPDDGHVPDNALAEKEACSGALTVFSQVATGLAFLHQHGIAHRDISLENIMLHRGRCKLGDLGLATRALRICGRHAGKKYYMAPEVVAGDTFKQIGVAAILHEWGMARPGSYNTIHLLSGMLEIDPQKRITVAQAMGHPALSETFENDIEKT
ncbi:serine/threonine protein kinase [Phytophthora nicotianae CJ01A1]|uniref:Serine/threonine protein kinase n=5 Tax=Phytophthora nicotianae TaxID=4792 RepID=W2QTB7_PHYN3|nr:serine/threonine protein kinase [Phytophthora nicotianae INRA-310]ETI55690.1 serine/threonine protein kinase [Phytophthora nicotianae P1569]ETK95497.1 serine/threonine protein kinase [Phytophthora nicotianae]ETO84425.1 serine/threonine protein kinase [Phytophthora nicotianae P1976]ETP25501.1 serine/threonine protein kinase [Phytophthora nicotianae CJ01A1]ETL48884.1 serine/threonine protein kinase [Phytophthora nicotianae]